jgi:hypothetical protein
MPKLTGLEHSCVILAAACLGAKLLAGTPFWLIGLIGGLGIGAASFALRKGWQPSL